MIFRAEDADRILSHYNIGNAISVHRILSGYSNINFKITGSKGKYFLKIFRDKPIEKTKYEIKVLKELKKIDFPTAYPIARNDGQYINQSEFGDIVIYEFSEGDIPVINSQTVREIAKATAIINSYENWELFKNGNPLDISLCFESLDCIEKSGKINREIYEFVKDETLYSSELLSEKLPLGLVHGDIFPDNTKFKGDRLVAILDFEEVCTDHLMYDVGVSINGFCFTHNRLDQNLLRIFMNSYQSIRELSEKEQDLLPGYIRWGAHVLICWHLQEYISKDRKRNYDKLKVLTDRINELRRLPTDFYKCY